MPQDSNHIKYSLLPALVRFVFRLILFTCRIRFVDSGGERIMPGKPYAQGRLFALWHQHLLFGAWFLRNQGMSAIVSQSRDGEYLSRIMSAWGFRLIRGSSSKGGAEVVEASVELLRRQGGIWITPDGPRGPYHAVKWGVIRMAMNSGSVILPMGFGYSRKITLKSWDKFQVPLPFSRIVIIAGEPFNAQGPVEEEKVKRTAVELEQRLNALTDRAHQEALKSAGS